MTATANPRKTKPAPPKPLAVAGKPVTKDQVRRTLATLMYYKKFLASDYPRCIDIDDRLFETVMTKDQARRRLDLLYMTAINRKACIPDPTDKQIERERQWQRDQRKLVDIAHRIRHYQFESKQCRERFAHLLSRYDD